MGISVDFGGRDECEKQVREDWNKLRSSLLLEEFDYLDIAAIKQSSFMNVSNDILTAQDNATFLTKTFGDIKRENMLRRGTKIMPNENVSYERMRPKAEFITEDNRFSPEGVEWLMAILVVVRNRYRYFRSR